ncbi:MULTISPECIES: hypothetical protein [unclassified Myroides]|uniref:hypothetical protein n=1 Tax=unclassified Myroides TaxID=2642485 RepID=UPI0031011A9A
MRNLKIYIIAIFSSLLFANCQTPTDKALKLSEKELFSFLNDYDSYQNIEISEPTIVTITYSDDPEFIDKKEKYEQLDKLVGEISLDALIGNSNLEYAYLKHGNKFKQLEDLGNDLKRIEAEFVPFQGMKSIQKLRANNTANAKVIVTIEWIYDSELTKVISYRIVQ